MSNWLDIEPIRRKLEGRLQLPLAWQQETIDGGSVDALRPLGFEYGNGFSVLLSRTHKQVEASFKADNFAGVLLRVMSEADEQQKKTFSHTRQTAEAAGAHVYVAVNGVDKSNCLDLKDRWTRVEIDVSHRFPSGKSAKDVMTTAVQVASTCFSLALTLGGVGEETISTQDNAVNGLPEGAKLRVEVNRYERSPVNRAACIEYYGPRCQCCHFDFVEVYGDIGDGYIEVHHRSPVSTIGPNYIVDPVKDLVPLCGNCHAMVHRTDPPMMIEQLRTLVEARRVVV
jgi:5-methylcytosine-specific restriction protein A